MRYELSDFEWRLIDPLLPIKRRGVKPQRNRCSSMVSSGSCEPARPGEICLVAMAPTRLATIALIAGAKQAFGIA
jgi:hypothetical protein